MPRYKFGGGVSDWTFGTVTVSATPDLAQVAGGVVVTFFSAQVGGVQHTDLIGADGVTPATSVTSLDGTGGTAVGQIPRFSGPDGVTTMWAQAGSGPRALIVTSDAADIVSDPGMILPPLSVSGAVSTGAGVHRLYNDTTANLVIAGVRASVGTAPTGTEVIVDVHRNGTTIFPTQSNRPTIAVAANTSGKNTLAEVVTLNPGDYVTVDVDQTGTGAANLVVQILVTKG